MFDIYGVVADQEGVIWKCKGFLMNEYSVFFAYENVIYANVPNLFDKFIYIEQELAEDMHNKTKFIKTFVFEWNKKIIIRIIDGKLLVDEKDGNRQEIFDIKYNKLVKQMKTYFYVPACFVFGMSDDGNTIIAGHHNQNVTKMKDNSIIISHEHKNMSHKKFKVICDNILYELDNRF